jgi:signal transduction histidine kinase
MWSRIERRCLYRLARLRTLRISTKLTLVSAAILCSILVFTSLLTIVGIYFSVYHQADIEMQISIRHTLDRLGDSVEILAGHVVALPPPPDMPPDRRPVPPHADGGFPPEGPANDGFVDSSSSVDFNRAMLAEDTVLPGVVLRVTDDADHIVFDNAVHYPSLEIVKNNIDRNPPFWANKDMQVVSLRNLHLYYEEVDIQYSGREYHLHFLKTITAERHFLELLRNSLILTNLFGIIVALLAGYFVSRRTLRPIRTLTQAVRTIEVTDLGKRIEVPPAHDELSELADTYNHMLDRIQSGFEQQRRFVSDASHELRTPVTVIRGYSDMLSRWGRQDPQALDEGIAAIRSEAEDMQELIEKLLFLARTDQKRQILRKEYLCLPELIDDIMKKAKLVDTKHTVELLQNDEAEIFADPGTIRQMLRIFLENSMKYTPEGGRITASSKRAGKYIIVELADTGIGIAKENKQKVFERFYRVDSARTKAEGGTGGTGLGLSIARWIADRHGIAIALESELGMGTKVILTIPVMAKNT